MALLAGLAMKPDKAKELITTTTYSSQGGHHKAHKWQSYDTQIEIVEGFEDLWVAVECRSNDSGKDEGKLNIGYFRGIKIELA